MRIAYYLNDGTRKIGNVETFREDCDAGNVDASRQAALELKRYGDFWAFGKARAVEAARSVWRRREATENAFLVVARVLRVLGWSTLVVGAARLSVFCPAEYATTSGRVKLAALYLLAALAAAKGATALKNYVAFRREARATLLTIGAVVEGGKALKKLADDASSGRVESRS